MAGTWNHARALKHIDIRMDDVRDVTVKDYVRDMSLESIPTKVAYRIDCAHLYAEIKNLNEMLELSQTEGVDCHKRTLRFLDQFYRTTGRVLNKVDARRVDFHSQRLHAIFAKPYNGQDNSDAVRIQRSVAAAQLLIDVLAEVQDNYPLLPAAKVRIGIDAGRSLAVNNGRHGYREPLFLGNPANQAAKLASNSIREGVYLSNEARLAIGLAKRASPHKAPLTHDEIKSCQEAVNLGVTVDEIVEGWRDDITRNPIADYKFSRQTPPLSNMDITALTPANSKRQEMVCLYADIDGFTAYVSENIDHNAEDVVRTLHVLRAELERVVTSDFKGRRVRFIGDCIQAVICNGTAYVTDEKTTISEAARLAGALRSSFSVAMNRLAEQGWEAGDLGLAIGFDFGPVSVTRLGKHGDRIRCAIGRKVIEAEKSQQRCSGMETEIGRVAYDRANEAVRALFTTKRRVANLDYVEATEALADSGDASAKAVRATAFGHVPAVARSAELDVRPYSIAPGKGYLKT